METLDDMWEALEAHQPMADHKGYGEAWARMCRTRTAALAAANAALAAALAADADADDAALAAVAVDVAAFAADAAVHAFYTKQAIQYITKANDGLAYVRSKLTERKSHEIL